MAGDFQERGLAVALLRTILAFVIFVILAHLGLAYAQIDENLNGLTSGVFSLGRLLETPAQIVVDAPASGVLEINDEIVSVDGTEIATPEDVRDALQEFEPGDTVPFEILRGEEEQSVQVPTGETDERTVIGVYLASEFDLPYEIDIDAGNVGGPSAGLMFALAVYDKITPGAMTGGQAFAGTGTITSAGEVGPIGGIRQKMIAAEQSGADYFLAPADNCDDVRGNEPDGLTVARVETFEQAREIVEGVGAGESIEIPSC
jgi:PDZ domain-containing protein